MHPMSYPKIVKVSIYYLKHTRDSWEIANTVTVENLNDSHVHLKDWTNVHMGIQDTFETICEQVFRAFQADMWSPNGEARALIASKGLWHTSMSVGDVIAFDDTTFFVVSPIGFRRFIKEA